MPDESSRAITLATTIAQQAEQVVDSHMETVTDLALDEVDNARAELAGLSAIEPFFVQPTLNEIDTTDLGVTLDKTKPDAVEPLVGTIGQVTPVEAFSYEGAYTVDTEGAPSFGIPSPILSYGRVPSSTMPDDAGDVQPVLTTEGDIPTEPTVVGGDSIAFPPVPTFEDYTFPDIPAVPYPAWDGTKPSWDITDIEAGFTYTEPAYDTDFQDVIKAKIRSDIVNGTTGLDITVEDELWDRFLQRQETQNEQTYLETEEYFSSRGYTMPPGAMAGRIQETRQEISRANTIAAAEISIEQARLAQNNMQFALKEGTALENAVWAQNNAVAQRSFEVAKYVFESEVVIFNTKVARFNTQLELYKAEATVYEMLLRGALSVLELYKQKLEGVKIQASIDSLKMDRYKAQVDAIDSFMNIYRTRMEVVNTKINIDRLNLDQFRTRIENFASKVESKKAEFELYNARIAGEVGKVQAYGEQVRAYQAESNAYSAKVGALAEAARASAAGGQAEAQAYTAQVESYRAQMQYELGQYEANVKARGVDVERFEADVKRIAEYNEATVKEYTADIEKIKMKAQIDLAKAELTIKEGLEGTSQEIEKAKTIATVHSQIAASSLAAVDVGASLSGTGQGQASADHSTYGYDPYKSEAIIHEFKG